MPSVGRAVAVISGTALFADWRDSVSVESNAGRVAVAAIAAVLYSGCFLVVGVVTEMDGIFYAISQPAVTEALRFLLVNV